LKNYKYPNRNKRRGEIKNLKETIPIHFVPLYLKSQIQWLVLKKKYSMISEDTEKP
jgi:hypothetical protein